MEKVKNDGLTKVDLSFKLKDESGVIIAEADAGSIVARILAAQTEGDSLKMFGWARRFSVGEVVPMDASDLKMFKEFIETKSKLPALTRCQILEILG